MTFSIRRSLITVAVMDWQQSLTFYRNLLQLEPQVLQPGRYAEFRLADCTISLYKPRLEETPTAEGNPYPSLGICLHVDSLQAALAQLNLVNHGIQASSHGREVYLYDPNGNRIILYEPH